MPRKGTVNNPKGRPKGKPNRLTKDAREIVRKNVEELAPFLREKFDELEPKDWVAAYTKLLEFVMPKISPVQAPDVDADRPDVVIEV